MDKNTLFSSFGKYVKPINIVKLQQRIDETDQDKGPFHQHEGIPLDSLQHDRSIADHNSERAMRLWK